MKKIIFTFYLILSILKLNAQSSNRKLKIGINFSPDYCYRTLKTDNSSLSWIINSRNTTEIPKLSFSSGVNLLYQTNKHISFEGGMQYSNKGYIQKVRFTSNLDPDGNSETLIFNNLKYLDIPLRMIINLGENEVKFTSSIGIITSFNIDRKLVYTENGEVNKQKLNKNYNDFKDFNLVPTISLGIDYTFNDYLNLKIEPVIRYGVLNTTGNNIKEYLWNSGLNTTLYYTFKHY